MYVIPAIDVLDGKVVRLRQGRYDDITAYGDDPAAALEAWGEQGAPLVHVVDLAGARDGSEDRELWDRLGATEVPFQIGGGIRTLDRARAIMSAGASRVVLGTAAVWEPGVVESIVDALGAEAVVAAIDVRHGKAAGAGWLEAGRELDAVLADLHRAGVVRALATGIERDGMLTGPDFGLMAGVQRLAPDLALIASGGVGSLADISAVAGLGVEAVIVGRALYDGRFTYAEAVTAAATPAA